MTDSEKIMAAGCAAGAAAAVLPAAYGFVKARAKAPICSTDMLRCENGGFVSACGERVELRGINLNDDLFFFQKEDLPVHSRGYDAFSALESRFGNYGAREIIKKYEESFIAPSDIKYVSKLGANCVRIPLRYNYLFKKDNCKEDIDFDRLDLLVAKCRKAGLYVIFDLHAAPGFQNTSSSCGAESESVLFESGKAGFEARNSVIRLWTQVAAHFKDEPAVAAYDLLNRPLNRIAEWESKLDSLHKFYQRIYKAIRTVDENHIIIFEAVGEPETLPSAEKCTGKNIAFGLYSHFHTTYETNALVREVRELRSCGIPFIVCKIRSEENLDYSLTALNDAGISWLFGDFKGSGRPCGYLFSAILPSADLTYDSYEAIGEKWSKPLATKNFTENKDAAALLRQAFRYGAVSREIKTDRNKMKFKVKLGANIVAGINKPHRA